MLEKMALPDLFWQFVVGHARCFKFTPLLLCNGLPGQAR